MDQTIQAGTDQSQRWTLSCGPGRGDGAGQEGLGQGVQCLPFHELTFEPVLEGDTCRTGGGDGEE